MKKLVLVAAALAMCGFAVPASAFHPSEQTYGYESPRKLKRAKKKARQEAEAEFSFWSSAPSSARARQQDDDWGRDFNQKSRKRGPAQMSGGARPHISPAKPKTVSFPNSYGAGSIVVDTAGRRLYYVLSSSSAYSYPIAVGKQGFAWSGKQTISRKVAWPDWRPPAEMLARRPDLPQHMTGGVRNPLGAMALYLGNSLYRIHGTNDVKSIGTASSSGCIRMTNNHVMHLSQLAGVGTKVHVLHKLPAKIARSASSS